MSIHFVSPLVLTGPKLRCRMIVVRTDDRSKNKTYILNVLHYCLFTNPTLQQLHICSKSSSSTLETPIWINI